MNHPDEKYMRTAIEQAKLSHKRPDGSIRYPIGSVVVLRDGTECPAFTTLFKSIYTDDHAEMNAIENANEQEENRYLEGGWLYTTHEPCSGCASFAIAARLEGIAFGVRLEDFHLFNFRNVTDIPAEYIIKQGNPKLKLVQGFMEKQCLEELLPLTKPPEN